MIAEPTPGVYRHYKPDADGKPRYYQLLFLADAQGDAQVADEQTRVYVLGAAHGFRPPRGPFVLPASPVRNDERDRIAEEGTMLFFARAHGPFAQGQRVCVYVPLYADKPGLRISVRPLSEWIEWVKPSSIDHEYNRRFTYVGDTVPT